MWHTNSEHSTYSQEGAAACLPTFCLDTYLLELASLRSTQGESCCNDNATESFQPSRSGMTLPLWTGDHGADSLTLSQADSLAPTSVAPEPTTMSTESKWDSMANIVDCGRKCVASLARCGLRLRSSKTVQICAVKDLTASCKTLTRWGIMRNGACLGLGTLARTTKETGCGSSLPTPTSHNAKEGAYPAEFTRNTPTLAASIGGKINPNWNESRMMWPLGWTQIGEDGLGQSVMDSTAEWLRSHGKY